MVTKSKKRIVCPHCKKHFNLDTWTDGSWVSVKSGKVNIDVDSKDFERWLSVLIETKAQEIMDTHEEDYIHEEKPMTEEEKEKLSQ